jgi:hypothetical protein
MRLAQLPQHPPSLNEQQQPTATTALMKLQNTNHF